MKRKKKKLTPEQEEDLKRFIENLIGGYEKDPSQPVENPSKPVYVRHIVRIYKSYGYEAALQSAKRLIEDYKSQPEWVWLIEGDYYYNLLQNLTWEDLKPYVEEVVGNIIANQTIVRAEEIMYDYVEEEIQKLFQELENRELFISSPQEFEGILKNRLLGKNIFDKVKEDLKKEGYDWAFIEGKLAELFDEAIDYHTKEKKANKELISKFVNDFLAMQTAQNLWRISL